MPLDNYLRLAEWTSRQLQRGCEPQVPAAIFPLLTEVGIASHDWLPLVGRFGKLFHRVAGAPHSLTKLRTSWQFRRGRAELLGQR